MKKHFILFCLIGSFVFVNAAMASNDSIYFYKSGQIVFKRATAQIDSIAFVPIDYYEIKNNEAIFSEVKAIPEISLFASILEKTGLHKSLANRTVWAPTNEALANVDTTNMASLDSLVRNHVSDAFQIMYSDSFEEMYYGRMLNKKVYKIHYRGPVRKIHDCNLVKENIRHSNCVIHIIDKPIPYVMNVWEYLSQTTLDDEASAFRESVQSLSTVDARGVPSNEVLENIGNLSMESSNFVVVIPTKRACTDAFNKLYGYLHVNNDTASEKKHRRDSHWLLVRDQIVDQKVVNWYPEKPYLLETMTSAFGQTYKSQDLYEDSVSSMDLSNGRIVFVDTIRHLDSIFAEGDITIEAEEVLNPKKTNSVTMVVLTDTSSYVSGKGYLKCEPTTISDIQRVSLYVPVPRVRPGHYRILVDIVPPSIEDSTDLRTNNLNFRVYTVDTTKQGIVAKETAVLSGAVSKPATLTRITVAENYYFPYVGIFRIPGQTPIEVVRIDNNARRNETSIHDRTFRIDKIILERID